MLRLGRPLRAWLKDSLACVHALFRPRSKGDGTLDAAELDPWKPLNAFGGFGIVLNSKVLPKV